MFLCPLVMGSSIVIKYYAAMSREAWPDYHRRKVGKHILRYKETEESGICSVEYWTAVRDRPGFKHPRVPICLFWTLFR